MLLIAIICGFLADALGGFCLAHLWNMFIAPWFMIKAMSTMAGIGVMLTFSIIDLYNFSSLRSAIGNDPDAETIIGNTLMTSFGYLVVLGVGYVFHLFM